MTIEIKQKGTPMKFTFADLRGLIFAIACLALMPNSSSAQSKLVIAIQPTVASDEMLNKAKPLQQFLEKGLGGKTNVEIYVPTSYAAVVESLRFGHAHLAFMSAWPAQLAVRLGGAEVALAEIREVLHGKEKVEAPHYFSYWVVAPDSPYKDLHSLKGKSACFPSPISTSGFVAPMGRMIEMNLLQPGEGKEADPKAYFKEVLFGGGYGQCWQALKQGQVDTTVIAGDVPEKLYNEVLAGTRTVEQQGPIPSHAVVLSKELKDPLRARAVQTIVKLGAPEHRELMRAFISSIFVGFKPTTASEHLGSLQKYLKAANLKFTERL
jgi:phosphonate transport system substrate-binding protein